MENCKSDGNAEDVLITREEVFGKSKICKIIDFYGKLEKISKITAALDNLMTEKQYEFIDVYSYGVPTDIYETGGFIRCEEKSENIIPNYFHPFVRENIVLRMMEPPAEGNDFVPRRWRPGSTLLEAAAKKQNRTKENASFADI